MVTMLASLLTPEVYEGFENVIRERKERGETAETHLLSINATEIRYQITDPQNTDSNPIGTITTAKIGR